MTWINRQSGRSPHCINTQYNCNFIHDFYDDFCLYLTSGLPLSSPGLKTVLFLAPEIISR
ncbi:hypothetical protein CD006_11975 [Enterobacter sp. 10-1]|nr:hypothetical protein CD006_11975 [Enterobacter sp. 10-1]